MSKKLWKLISLALVLGLLGTAVLPVTAYAQGPGGKPEARNQAVLRPVVGQVTEIGDDRFTLTLVNGDTRSFIIGEKTRFTNQEKEELTQDDLTLSGWLAVTIERARRPGLVNRLQQWMGGAKETRTPAEGTQADRQVSRFGGTPTARLVVVLPDDFDPEAMAGVRGKVTAVAATSFSVETPQGESQAVMVNDETRYRGGIDGLGALEEGMSVIAITEEQTNGSLLALSVNAGYRPERRIGEVISINLQAGEFTIKTLRDGDEMTFSVDEGTRYRGREIELESLADLKTGMTTLVIARQEQGKLVASQVAAGEGQDLPEFEQRLGGRVTKVEDSSLTIKTRDGEQTVQVSAATVFRSRGDQVTGLDDLKEGMLVMIGANEVNGKLTAQVIITLPRLRR